MKSFFYLILIYIMSIGLTTYAKDPIYKIALSPSCPYYCTEGNEQGYIVDLLIAFFEKHKINIIFENTPYARLVSSLQEGSKDLSLLTSYDLRNNSDLFTYNITLGMTSAGIISKVGSNSTIIDFSDFIGKTVFIVPGSKSSERVYSQIKSLNKESTLTQMITGSKIHDRLIDLISLGRADYGIEDYNALKYFHTKSIHKEKVTLTPSSIAGYSPLMLVSRKGLAIQDIIDKNLSTFIQSYRKSGKLKKLLKKYNITDWNNSLSR